MPKKPDVPCRHPGCPRLVPNGERYCAEHAALHPKPKRAPEGKTDSDEYHKLYSRKWREASKGYLRQHPLCVRCQAEGRYTRATVVDHIVPHKGDRALFWDRNNWQPLCKQCHDKKTYYEDTGRTLPNRNKVYAYDFET